LQDVLPTLIELCGLKAPAALKPDGRSLAPLLARERAETPDRMMIVQYGQTPKKYESTVIWSKWRLVNGTELYDLKSDPGQTADLAEKNPEVARKMREHYDAWWAGVEGRLTDFAPISIGAKEVGPAELSSSDWQDIYCDNVGHVSTAAGGPRGGLWSVYVERAGEYEIELSRWPFWLGLPLSAGRAAQKMTKGQLPEGKALPIARVRLRIAGQERAAEAAHGDKIAKFKVKLDGGLKTDLQAWFQDDKGNDLAGCFYARVSRV
jgi:hypothetical protein